MYFAMPDFSKIPVRSSTKPIAVGMLVVTVPTDGTIGYMDEVAEVRNSSFSLKRDPAYFYGMRYFNKFVDCFGVFPATPKIIEAACREYVRKATTN